MIRTTKTVIGLLALAWLVSACSVGCNRARPATVMHGSVACADGTVSRGTVSFVPIEGTVGPISVGRIVDGHYRIDAAGGVPVGKYRVQVDARRKTGRKVLGNDGMEQAMVDEEVRVGPATYMGDKSPLTIEVPSDSDGQFDIVIPKN